MKKSSSSGLVLLAFGIFILYSLGGSFALPSSDDSIAVIMIKMFPVMLACALIALALVRAVTNKAKKKD